MMMMEKRSSRDLNRESNGSKSLQKRLAEIKRQQQEHVPDLMDFMNDMFFGMAKAADKRSYDLTGGIGGLEEKDDDDFESSTRSSRQMHEWLEHAMRIVAASPTRCDSPSRLSESPRFAAAARGRLSLSSQLDRRDPLSRSARSHRAVDGFSGKILTRSVMLSQNRSEILDDVVPGSPTAEESPYLAVRKWDSNILNPPSPPSDSEPVDPPQALLLPRQTTHRRSRFQTAQGILRPPRRTFKSTASSQLLSPPKNLVESSHRRSMSSGTCSLPDEALSPPRSLTESAHRRSISSSTCLIQTNDQKNPNRNGSIKDDEGGSETPIILNGFLKEQKLKIGKVLAGDVDSRAKIVLSGPSNRI